MFAEVGVGAGSQRDIADKLRVDRSTVVHICKTAKQGALDALALEVIGPIHERTIRMAQDPEATTASAQLEDANLFNISGPIVIHYSRSSIAGQPQLSFKDAELDLNFSGADIIQANSPMGELVTVPLENVVDAFVRTFTLLVPKIRLSKGDQVSFDTLGMETIDHSGAFTPPPGPSGVLQIYRSHQLQGTAEVVIF